jgi:hypothetical protein
MITPVENGSTCSGAQASSFATSAQVRFASAMPVPPVPALALPAFEQQRAHLAGGIACGIQMLATDGDGRRAKNGCA